MMKHSSPTITQANTLFFITAVITLASSALLQPLVGLGTNLWINEFIYILLPPLLLARVSGWSVEHVYRFRKTSAGNKVISILSGLCLWFFAAYLSNITRLLLDRSFGQIVNPPQAGLSIYQTVLLLIGMIVLAPICEEIFFRGFMQKAYEGRSKKYGFVITGAIFGAYHVLNGISEVLPACLLGIAMGYLVYKTDSIANSMLFHVAVNTCAAALGAVILIPSLDTIPVWHHVIALGGLCASVVLLRFARRPDQTAQNRDEDQKVVKLPAAGILFLILSAAFLISMGAFEILARLQLQ